MDSLARDPLSSASHFCFSSTTSQDTGKTGKQKQTSSGVCLLRHQSWAPAPNCEASTVPTQQLESPALLFTTPAMSLRYPRSRLPYRRSYQAKLMSKAEVQQEEQEAHGSCS